MITPGLSLPKSPGSSRPIACGYRRQYNVIAKRLRIRHGLALTPVFLNCLATVVVARREGTFDDEKASVFGTPEEVALSLANGEPALAQAAEQD
jgi:hypothetical protein